MATRELRLMYKNLQTSEIIGINGKRFTSDEQAIRVKDTINYGRNSRDAYVLTSELSLRKAMDGSDDEARGTSRMQRIRR